MMPMKSRVDYILVEGSEWVGDPNRRFHSIEFSEALIILINRLHIQIMNDLPKGFSLSATKIKLLLVLSLNLKLLILLYWGQLLRVEHLNFQYPHKY